MKPKQTRRELQTCLKEVKEMQKQVERDLKLRFKHVDNLYSLVDSKQGVPVLLPYVKAKIDILAALTTLESIEGTGATDYD